MTMGEAGTGQRLAERSDFLKLGGLLLALAVVLCFGWGLRAPFFFDDQASIWANGDLRRPWSGVGDLFPERDSPVSGRPIAALSLKLDYELFGLRPWAYRVENFAWHLLNVLLFCRLVAWGARRSGIVGGGSCVEGLFGGGSRAALFAWCMALVWSVHPLNLDAVVYITQRTELLCSFFYLVTVVSACVWNNRWGGVVAVLACFLGMASKEVMASAPLAVLLVDRAFLSGSFKKALLSRPWLYLGLGASWSVLLALVLFRRTGESIGFDLGVSGWDYLLTQSGVILWYVSRVFYPVGLSIHHGWPVVESWRDAWLSGPLVLALVGASFWLLWKKPAVGTVAVLFWFLLAPSSSVVPIVTEIVAERRMYLPGACVLLLSGVGLVWLWDRVPLSDAGRRYGLPGMVMLAVGVGLLVNQVRLSAFSDTVSIWEEVVAQHPEDPIGLTNLGVYVGEAGDWERAELLYRRSLELQPNSIHSTVNLGGIYLRRGELDQAEVYLRRTLAMRPEHDYGLLWMGVLEGERGNLEEAHRWFTQTAQLYPYMAQAFVNLAVAEHQMGNQETARQHLLWALHVEPDNEDALDLWPVIGTP